MPLLFSAFLYSRFQVKRLYFVDEKNTNENTFRLKFMQLYYTMGDMGWKVVKGGG
jgi:hypothetical protein